MPRACAHNHAFKHAVAAARVLAIAVHVGAFFIVSMVHGPVAHAACHGDCTNNTRVYTKPRQDRQDRLPKGRAVSVLPLVLNLTAPLAVTAPAFLGCNIDTASMYQGTLPHRLDFTSPTLNQLGKAFASAGPPGSTLRVGGSTAEDTVFGPAQPPNRVAVDPDYWDELVGFARASGFEMAWDLNGFGGHMRLKDGTWDASNAKLLLKHVLANNQGGVVRTLQLGNEPGHFAAETPGAPQAAAHGRDFVKLRALVEELVPDPQARPVIQGPDVCFGKFLNCSVANCTSGGDKCADLDYFETLLHAANGTIDEVTVHNYGTQPTTYNLSHRTAY